MKLGSAISQLISAVKRKQGKSKQRLFDIWKPWLVGRADRRGDPAAPVTAVIWPSTWARLAMFLA